MRIKRLIGCGLLAAAATGLVTTAYGQESRGRRGGYDPSEFVKRMDANGNGMIDPDEMSDRSRGFLQRAAERAGLNMNGPLPVDKLTDAFNQMREERGSDRGGDRGSDRGGDRGRGDWGRGREGGGDSDRSRSDSSSSSSSSSSSASPTPQPATLGFGVPDTATKAAGFDVPLGQDEAQIEQRFERRVIDYVERMLAEQDKNKDGYIDSIEWQAGRWATPPEESDTNNDKRLSKLELCVRIAKRFGGDRQASQDEGSSPASSSSSGAPSGPSTSSQGPGGDTSRYRSYAESIIKQHDKDGSGMLEKSRGEWDGLKTEQREADVNNDGVVTLDELVVKLQAYSSRSSGSPGSTSGYSGRSSSRGPGSPEQKKSYRFLSPTERLPKGLPDWFARNDADGDGQIMMAEFAAAWTEAAANEFMRLDRDGDGVITPKEALASGGSSSSSSSSSYGERSSSSYGERSSSSGERSSSYGERSSSSSGERPSYGERSSSSDRRSSYGERSSSYGERSSSYGERRR